VLCLVLMRQRLLSAGTSGEASTPQRTPRAVRCVSRTAQQAQRSSAATDSGMPSKPAPRPCEAGQAPAPRRWLGTGMVTYPSPHIFVRKLLLNGCDRRDCLWKASITAMVL